MSKKRAYVSLSTDNAWLGRFNGIDSWEQLLDVIVNNMVPTAATVSVIVNLRALNKKYLAHPCLHLPRIRKINVTNVAGDSPMFRWDERTCACACHEGNLPALQWLRAKGCPWDEWSCAHAAANGHLNMLQWVRSESDKCPWNEYTCAFASANGHLEVLQWARANGCPWNTDTCADAAYSNHPNVLEWAVHNGCPWDESTKSYVRFTWPWLYAEIA